MKYKLIVILITLSYLSFQKVAVNAKSVPSQNCTCVPFYQCSYDSGDLIMDGTGLLDLRILKNSPCQGYFDVCCNISKVAPQSTTEAPHKKDGCGFENSGFFPWYAALYFQLSKDFPAFYKCGVSLIHSKVVLTAAHCVTEEGIWIVQIGNTFHRTSKIVIHPEFNKDTIHNDIALVILETSVDISDKINSICIPPPGIILDNAHCKTASRIMVPNSEGGNYLKMLQITVISKDKCIEMLRSTRLGAFFQLHTSFLCAGKENQRNTCFGDGGSPLICPVPGQPGRYHQAGIVSWGIDCGESNAPDVYVKVPAFRDWIDVEMVKNGLEITPYRY